MQILSGLIILNCYFIYTYFLDTQRLKNTSVLLKELNTTATSETIFAFVDNAQRMLYINNTFPILGRIDSWNVSLDNIN